jgi:FKBP-type peptidyl-prolyl cis-trans isomerase
VLIGGKQVVSGFENGLTKLRVGEKALLIFPSAIGYGTTGSGATIQPYSPLLFDIEVLKVN